MKTKNYWTSYPDTLFPLDKTYKRRYNNSSIPQKSKSSFANYAAAEPASGHLYADNTRDKTRSGFSSVENREYNRERYGVPEESKQTLDLFSKKTTGVLNPKLPDDADRAFLSGFMGKEAEENYYRKKLSNSTRTLDALQGDFRSSQFEGALKPTVQRLDSPPAKINDVNRNSNAKPNLAQLSGAEKHKLKDDLVDFFIPPVLNPEKHKEVWALGANTYLTMKGYHSSAWLLKHSLEDNPKDVYRDDNSRIANLIKNDPAFLKELDMKIANSKGKMLYTTIPVTFQSGDLYYSIHKSNIKVSGYKGNDGKWKISARLADKYDFTELTTWMDGTDAMLGTLANDSAAFSQKLGAITPYYIYVDFNLER